VFTGRVVRFDLSGYEPDLDPLYRVVIDATLHDGQAYPDAHLVLSCYLESFQPGNVPVLPDLLHPEFIATDLVGFLHGKAALSNAAGTIAYSGDVLAEIFRNNDVHITVQLYDVRDGSAAQPVELTGIFTLSRGGTQHGWLRAADASSLAALASRRGRPISWRQVIRELAVPTPIMMGSPASPGTHQNAPTAMSPGHLITATGVVVLIATIGLGLLRRRRGSGQTRVPPL
jgi:hypothetical protein